MTRELRPVLSATQVRPGHVVVLPSGPYRGMQLQVAKARQGRHGCTELEGKLLTTVRTTVAYDDALVVIGR